MLKVSRKVGETIVINKNISITFTKISSNGTLQLSIEAPKTVPIDRLEIHKYKEATAQNEILEQRLKLI